MDIFPIFPVKIIIMFQDVNKIFHLEIFKGLLILLNYFHHSEQ